MSPRKQCNQAIASVGAGPCHINALPDGVLHHILGFLDSREAVQTSVLARRWRHLWKSATAVRVIRMNLGGVLSFMEHLLLLRGSLPFDTFHLCFFEFEDGDVPHVNLWVRHALLCKVRELKVFTSLQGLPLDDLPLVSKHLRSLQLIGTVLKHSLCDLSSCPSLEHLKISNCILPCAKKISSQSLKRLTITGCSFNQGQRFRTHIYAPNVVSLILNDQWLPEQPDRIPVLDSMPSLREASVRLAQNNADCCSHADESGSCGHVSCNSCYDIEHDNNSLLLEGLSEAENLELLAESKTFVFKRDLKQCPTFTKLRTLLLNDYWCVAPDFLALTRIIKQSPILEKLTLELFSKRLKHKLRIKGSRIPMQISVATRPLKTVEIKCEVIDWRIIKIMKFLSTFHIRFSLEEAEILDE